MTKTRKERNNEIFKLNDSQLATPCTHVAAAF
jgi:hypothetical protein